MSNFNLSELKIAIVHYWFLAQTGGEKVVEAIAELFPQADLFALVADRSSLSPTLRNRRLTTSFLQKIPGSIRFHRHLLPLQPVALEQLDLTGYDIVISSDSGPAKGVITSEECCHICYCHSPMRYIWDMYPQYQRGMRLFVRPIFSAVAHYMRMWDLATAARVNYFVANSQFIASRIRKIYGRESNVIYPPVKLSLDRSSDFCDDYYLTVGRLVDYKRFDLAVEACTRTGRKLRVVGDGPCYKALKRIAGSTVRFLGPVGNTELGEQFRRCRALLFPGQEDFGIVPVEAQSFGRPVIAYGAGGSLETVIGIRSAMDFRPEATGIFFRQQTPESLLRGIEEFETCEPLFNRRHIQLHAQKFSAERFKQQFSEYVSARYLDFQGGRPQASLTPTEFDNKLMPFLES